jgi:transcriptional regulator with XRE-family HTH domain
MKAADSLLTLVKFNAERKNISLRALAKELGYSPGQFHEVISGKRNIDLELLRQLADFFGLPLISLYESAGMISATQDDIWLSQLNEIAATDDDMKKLIDALASLPVSERKERVRLILAALGK